MPDIEIRHVTAVLYHGPDDTSDKIIEKHRWGLSSGSAYLIPWLRLRVVEVR